MSEKQHIGSDHFISYFGWKPDRELNPQYADIPDEPKAGLTIDHPRADNGEQCSGVLTFDTESMRKLYPDRPLWKVESWEPLTLSPSIACDCGDHGHIKNGRWESA